MLGETPNLPIYIFRGLDILIPEDTDTAAALEALRDIVLPAGLGLADHFIVDFPDGSPPCRAALAMDGCPTPEGWKSVLLRSALNAAAESPFSVDHRGPGKLFRAYHLAQWRRNSVFCGRCGSRNADAADETARLCPDCGRREYPRISPAVITAVRDGAGRLLLGHNAKFRSGMYSLIAGFVEAGESLEEAVAREVMEETGIAVRDIRYVASQDWPFPDSMMLGFEARAVEGTDGGPAPDPVPDGLELVDVRWFFRESPPDIPGRGSLSRLLIDRWLEDED